MSIFNKVIRLTVGGIKPLIPPRATLGDQGPDFLGIGAQKAGSTWLHENLRYHPGVFLPEKKELHYFSGHFHESLRSYCDNFKSGVGRVKGEITPDYGILAPRRIRYIRALMPEVRLIFIMRNPVERAWSQAVMNLVTKPNRRIEDVRDEEFLAHFTGVASRRRGSYISILDNWSAVFRSDQILVGFFEDIAARPKELLSGVFRHIGASCEVDWDRFPYRRVIRPAVGRGSRVGESRGAELSGPMREFLECLYARETEQLYQRFGEPVAHWRSDKIKVAA